jgi:methionine-rich copper-binding protein CopC
MRRPSSGRVIGRALLLLAAVGATLTLAPPAQAHPEVVSVTPRDQGTLDAPPDAVRVEFTEEVSLPAAVSVVSPAGAELASGSAAVLGDQLTQGLSDGGSGTYTVLWQVTSADGHLAHGLSSFTVRGAGGSAGGVAGAERLSQPAALGVGLGLVLLLSLAAVGVGRLSRETVGG